MKKILTLSILTISFCCKLMGQGETYTRYFNEINGNPLEWQAYTSVTFDRPDLSNQALPNFWEGEPDSNSIKYWTFKNIQDGINSNTDDQYHSGNFFVTKASTTPMAVEIRYGYLDQENDRRFNFEKVTYSIGRYNGAETREIKIDFDDISHDCNIFKTNCRVYQTSTFTIPVDKVFYGKNHYGHVNLLTLRYYMAGKIAHTLVVPYVVFGKVTEYLSTGPGPYELLNIIRAVPGDQSVAFMSEQTSTTSEVKIGAQKSDSQTNSLSASLKAGFSLGPIGGKIEADATMSITNTAVEGSENTYTQTFVAETTYKNDNKVGDKTDLFIAAIRKYDFGMEYKVDGVFSSRGYTTIATIDNKMLFYPLEVIKTYSYTEKQLIYDIIPALESSKDKGKADYWKLLLHKNDSIKRHVKTKAPTYNFSASISGAQSSSYEFSRSSELTLSQEISIENTESVSVKVEGSNASIEGGKSWVVSTTTSSSNTNGQGDKVKTGYTIFDQDYLKKDSRGGDKLHLKVWVDPTTGTAVWELDEALSATSCPYEGGYQSDQPEITVTDPTTQTQEKTAAFLNIPVSDERTFDISISNSSREQRAYNIRIPNTTSKPIIESADDLGTPFILGAGETATIRLTVKNKESNPKEYRNFEVIFGPECDASVCDTVLLSASFVGDDVLTEENDCISANGFYDNFNKPTPPTNGVIGMSYFVDEWGGDSYTRSGTGDLAITVEKQNYYMGCSFSDIEKKVFVDVSSSNLVHVALTNKGTRDIDVNFAFISGDMDETKVEASSNGELFGGEIAAGATMIKTFNLKDATTRTWFGDFQKNSLFDPTELSEIVWRFNLRYIDGFRVTGYNYPVNFHYIAAGETCQSTVYTDKPEIESDFTVFPNPAKNVLNVAYSGDSECIVTLIDLKGRKIVASPIQKNNSSITFNTSNLNPGMYFVSLDDGENLIVRKVLIK